MKTSDLTVGAIYAAKKPSRIDAYAVQILDTKPWEMGIAWVGGQKKFVIREAPGMFPSYTSYRSVGVPVLMVDADLSQWSEDRQRPGRQIMDSHEGILYCAAKKLGIERASDAAGEFDYGSSPFRVRIAVTMDDGSESVVNVILTTVRPQAITGAWRAYLAEKNQENQARALRRKTELEEETRREQINRQVAARMDAILGEAGRNSDSQRQDCQRWGTSDFRISEATLLRLLELAENGAQR